MLTSFFMQIILNLRSFTDQYYNKFYFMKTVISICYVDNLTQIFRLKLELEKCALHQLHCKDILVFCMLFLSEIAKELIDIIFKPLKLRIIWICWKTHRLIIGLVQLLIIIFVLNCNA